MPQKYSTYSVSDLLRSLTNNKTYFTHVGSNIFSAFTSACLTKSLVLDVNDLYLHVLPFAERRHSSLLHVYIILDSSSSVGATDQETKRSQDPSNLRRSQPSQRMYHQDLFCKPFMIYIFTSFHRLLKQLIKNFCQSSLFLGICCKLASG